MTDREFLAAVERAAQGVPPCGFHFGHREHLRLAWLQPNDDVVATTLQRLDRAHGGSHYNETVTRFWLALVRHARTRFPGRSFDAVVAEHPQLLDGTMLTRHYSRPLLASAGARTGCVPPDLAPLPWAARSAVQ